MESIQRAHLIRSIAGINGWIKPTNKLYRIHWWNRSNKRISSDASMRSINGTTQRPNSIGSIDRINPTNERHRIGRWNRSDDQISSDGSINGIDLTNEYHRIHRWDGSMERSNEQMGSHRSMESIHRKVMMASIHRTIQRADPMASIDAKNRAKRSCSMECNEVCQSCCLENLTNSYMWVD